MEKSIKFKFEGQNHSIDANTVINTLIHYQSIINTINEEIGEGNYKIKMQVNAFEQGSFIIDVSLITNFIKTIFSKENVGYLSDLIVILKSVFTCYKRLKGRPVKNKQDIPPTINNIHINIEKVIKVYNNQPIREAISKTIETSNEDVSVEGFVVECDNEELTRFNKEEFKDLIYTDFADEVEDIKEFRNIIIKDVTLNIITLSFEQSAYWKVLYKGNKIKIPLKDETLIKLIDNGEKFGKGDSLRVDLEVSQRFNSEANAYENKSYKIAQFKEHIQRNFQAEMEM